MSLSDELRDPWAVLVAGVSGGMAWALVPAAVAVGPAAVAVGVGVGAAVLGVKAVTGLLVHREPERRTPEPERPPRGSVAGRFFEQAETAVTALDEMVATASPGPTGSAARSAAQDADDALLALGRVGAQVTAVERALERVDDPELDDEVARLSVRAERAPEGELRREMERSVQAVRERLEVRNRLRGTRDTLLARMQSVTLGLEGLVARLAEVLAMVATTGGSDDAARDLAEIGAELDGLRSGLAESEAVSRRVLAPLDLPDR